MAFVFDCFTNKRNSQRASNVLFQERSDKEGVGEEGDHHKVVILIILLIILIIWSFGS